MRVIDNIIYYTIGEVGKIISRSPQTIKNWMEWYIEQPEEVKNLHPLPAFKRDIGFRGTRHVAKEDVPLLVKFMANITYGKLAETNRKKWAKK